ncbi:MAG: CARDB domain-containing protein, partial [Limnohabitans sp.]|nr:CARDB domain-containing protein [Limnohabitans sp.]
AGNAVVEFPIDDANNVAIGASPTEVTLPPRPNLTVAIIETPAPGAPGSLRSLRWTTTNSGASSTTGSWVERVYASPDATVGGDTLLGEFGFSTAVAAGAVVERTREVQVPAMASGYRIVVAVDAAAQMFEESESDNIAIAATASEVLLPDLAVAEVTAPADATADASMVVSWSVRNDGVVNATGSWVDAVFLSTDDVVGPGDRLVASRPRSGPIPTGVSYAANATFTVPSDLVGPMRVLVETDVGKTLLEPPAVDTTAANSRAAAIVTNIAQPERPDLVVTTAASPASGLVGAALSVQYTVTNQGGSSATGTWTDRVVARNTATQAETHLGDVIVAATVVGNGGNYGRQLACTYPLAEGTYQLVVTTDHSGTVLEDVIDGESNNTWTAPTTWTVGTFTVSAATDFVEGPIPQTVTISGVATVGASSDPVGGVPVRVRVGVRGTERQLAAVTAADGSYSVGFNALPNEAGIYTVRAGPVGAQGGSVQDTFTLHASRLEAPYGWQTLYPGTGQATGSLILRNLGDAPQSGLTLEIGTEPEGIHLDVSLPSTNLGSLGTLVLPFTATASADATGNHEIPVTVRSGQGTISSAVLRFSVTNPLPSLVATPASLSGTMVIPPSAAARTQVFYDCSVRNGGAGVARNVRVIVPPGSESWLSVVGGSQLGDLAPGTVATFVLQVSAPPGLAFGPYSGIAGIIADNASAQLPFTFQAISSATGTLVVETADERTYYQTENPPYPPLAGAYIEVRDAYTGVLVASGTTQESGRLEFIGLPESYYRVRAIATDHGDFEGNTLVRPGQSTVVSAYLPEQFVSYTWTVTPTTIDDEYDITIDLEFETNVPFPVVTIDPGYVDIQDVLQGQQFGQILYTLRNRGLVDAEDVTFEVGSHPRYRLTPLITDVGILHGVPPGTSADACIPGSCVQIPVIVEDLAFEGGVAGLNCNQIVAVVRHWKECGILRSFEANAVVRIPGCPVPPPVCPDCPPQPPGCPNCPDWEPPIIQRPPVVQLNIDCDRCCFEGPLVNPDPFTLSLDQIVSSLPWIEKAKDTVKNLLGGKGGLEIESVKGSYDRDPCCGQIDEEYCIRSNTYEIGAELKGKVQLGLDVADFFDGIDGEIDGRAKFDETLNITLGGQLAEVRAMGEFGVAGLSLAVPFEIGASLFNGADEGTDCPVGNCLTGFLRVGASVEAGLDATGTVSARWLGSEEELSGTLTATAKLVMAVNGSLYLNRQNGGADSDCNAGTSGSICSDGLYVQLELQATLLGESVGLGCVDYWIVPRGAVPPDAPECAGDLGCPDTPQEFGNGSIGEETLASFYEMINAVPALAEEIELAVDAEPAPPQSGLCASVSVQLSQEIAIARAAFEAELELTNSSTTGSLDAVEIDLFVRDLEGNRADNKFFLTQPIVEGIGGVDGSDSLPGGQTCSARWTLIPSDLAAEQGPTQYFVSGTLSYIRGESTTTVPLFPVAILVMPNPSLHLKYFIEEVVYGDDPFTPEIEPSIPFDLGLLVRNEGSGEARDVRMVSSQPRIVENTQNLLIDFQLLGTRLGLQPLTPNLAVHLGDIPADSAQTVRWIMLSSLQGRFVDYDATVESRNGFGDPSLSLVDSVEIFPLTHVVRALGDVRDRLPDFLVDEIPDAQDLADRLHRSDGPVDAVVAVTSGLVERDDSKLEATVQVTMPTGWAYIRLNDPFENAYRLAAVERADGTQILLGDNAWQTSRVSRPLGAPPVAERRVHIFDAGGTGAYRLIYEPDSVAPRVISWASLRQHGLESAVLRFGSGKLATEPRAGGCEELLVSFDEPVRRSTFGDAAVVVTA